MSSLDMPSFDDFLAHKGQTGIREWCSESLKDVQREIGFSFDFSNPDDLQRFASALISLNLNTSVRMLRDYHTWLTDTLSQRSIRLL